MKIRKTLVATLMALIMGASASAQDMLDFGLKGGIALNMMPWTTAIPYDEFQPNIGFQAGGFGSFYLSDNILGQIELLYSRKGVRTVNHSTEIAGLDKMTYTRNINYIQIPVLIGWYSLFDNKLELMTGPELGICLGSKIKANYDDPVAEALDLNTFNLAWALQSTYFILDSLGVDVKLEYGITKTFRPEANDRGHNAAFQLGICYRFGY